MNTRRITATIWPADDDRTVEIRLNFQYVDVHLHEEYRTALTEAFLKCGYSLPALTQFFQSIVYIPRHHMRTIRERIAAESDIELKWHDLTRRR